MRQLSGLDASFLSLETRGAPMHVGTLMVYDSSTAPTGEVTFERILQNIEHRLHLARTFRERIVSVPMDLDHPYWIEDPNFDLEFHVRRVTLPRPGDSAALWTEAASILARPLDLSRPAWEIHVIDGLYGMPGTEKGGFALVEKIHHAAIDGLSGMEILAAIHDRTPDAEPDPPDAPWSPEQEPSPWELLARAGINNLSRPARFADLVRRTMPALIRTQESLRRQDVRLPEAGAPQTRFNRPVGPDRILGGLHVELSAVRRAKSRVPRATTNDAVIAVVGGALRRYLASLGELPDDSLTALVPISVRERGDKGRGGNRVSAMFIPLCTDVADATDRLKMICEATHASKQFAKAVGARELIDYSEFVPGGLAALAARTSSSLAMVRGARSPYNCVVTNVPGPRTPIYFSGARLTSMFGTAPISDGMGLMHVILSYCGRLSICFTSCHTMIPDPTSYTACLEASFAELSGGAP